VRIVMGRWRGLADRAPSRNRMKDKIVAFFTDVVKEMNKVTWPKKNELWDSTLIVLVVCMLLAAFVYVADTAVSTILRQVL
jgi:preprotein translocase subunit SecE